MTETNITNYVQIEAYGDRHTFIYRVYKDGKVTFWPCGFSRNRAEVNSLSALFLYLFGRMSKLEMRIFAVNSVTGDMYPKIEGVNK